VRPGREPSSGTRVLGCLPDPAAGGVPVSRGLSSLPMWSVRCLDMPLDGPGKAG
jgi:hypothetical protein